MIKVTIWEVFDTADGEVMRASHQRDRAQAWLDSRRKDSPLDLGLRQRTIEDVEPKVAALAAHLDVSPDTIEPVRHSDDTFEVSDEPGEYRVLTEDERETAARDYYTSLLDDLLSMAEREMASRAFDKISMADDLINYFDRDRWLAAQLEGDYGQALASYDGDEHEQRVDGAWFYIYRVN